MYKITNKTFQPINIIFNNGDNRLIGGRKDNNIVVVEELTAQLENLKKRGFIKIRKMS